MVRFMNKKFLIIAIVASLLIIAGGIYLVKLNRLTDNLNIASNPQIKHNDTPEVASTPKEYNTLEEAVQAGVVVITNDNKIYNKANLDRFIKNTEINSKKRKDDSVTIMQFTREGDPIVTELSYTNNSKVARFGENTSYILKRDNTRDKFSAEEDRKVTVNDDIPGEVYGITEVRDGDTVEVVLVLYAKIEYVDENVKQYENIHVCSYGSNAEVVNK